MRGRQAVPDKERAIGSEAAATGPRGGRGAGGAPAFRSLALAVVCLLAALALTSAGARASGGGAGGEGGHETGRLLLDLFILFVGAKLGGEICLRLRQPVVAGEILAGMIIGPHLLGLVSGSEFLGTFAQLCVVFLLFIVGLEVEPAGLLRVGKQSSVVALAGMLLPFGLALALMHWLQRPMPEALFVGAAMTATSVGITARVLADMGQLRTRVAQVILGAAVMDDIGGMLVLAVVSGITAGALSGWEIGALVGETCAFLVLAVMLGRPAMRRLSPGLYRSTMSSNRSVLFALAIAVCFAFSALAEVIGLAAIIGAFFAGIIFSELQEAPELRRSMEPIYELLVPIFFVLMGANVDVPRLLSMDVLPVGLVITALAIIGKVVGCGVASFRLGLREALAVGVGMAPRGEVGIVVALIGLSKGVVSNDVYAQVILMSVLTSLFAPSLLRVLLVPPAEADPDKQEASS